MQRHITIFTNNKVCDKYQSLNGSTAKRFLFGMPQIRVTCLEPSITGRDPLMHGADTAIDIQTNALRSFQSQGLSRHARGGFEHEEKAPLHESFHELLQIDAMAAQLYKTASGRLFHAGAIAIVMVGYAIL